MSIYIDEKALEKAVYEEVEERTGSEKVQVAFIKKMNYKSRFKENHISIGYHIPGDNTKYWGWYYWRDGDLVHDFTTEIEDSQE